MNPETLIQESIHFSTPSFIHAARFEQSIIILNSATDQYISLVDDAAYYLEYILSHSFTKTNNEEFEALDQQDTRITKANLTSWISYFLEKEYILFGSQPTLVPSPREQGGLINYAWDTK